VKKLIGLIVLTAVALLAPGVRAEESPGRDVAQASPQNRQIPLKVQLVVARYQGEKKVSSLPYTLAVVANDKDKTSMRMGVEVPIPQTIFTAAAKEGATASTPQMSYTYRSIGTNIDCTAQTLEEGVFKLDLGVSDSSVFTAEKDAAANRPISPVSIRNFTSTFNVVLRDGQTVQHTSATDPVSGEVLRIDVTLTVLK
jgi:hypothetical protein